MSRSRAVLAGAGLFAVALWLALRGGAPPPEPDPIPLTPAAQEKSVWIESTAGIPLAELLVEQTGGALAEFRVADLDREGRWVLPYAARSVRAAGHLARDLSGVDSGDQLALEPDALLELDSPPGRALVVRVIGESASSVHPEYSAGWSSAGVWAAAVSSESGGALRLSARIGPWTRAEVRFDRRRGNRARLLLPGPRPAAPLAVELVHALRRPPGPTKLRAAELGGAPDPVTSSADWGAWTLHRASAGAGLVWEPGTSKELDLGALPLGARIVLQGRDERTGAWGRIEFEHDGSSRRLELHGGLSVTGRVRSSGGRSWSGGRVRAAFLHGDGRDLGPDEELLWRADVALGEDGEFHLAFPAVPPPGSGGQPIAPPRLLLAIEAEGHASLQRTLPAPTSDLELEELVLEALPAGAAVRLPFEVGLEPGLEPGDARSVLIREGAATVSRPVVRWLPAGEPGGPALDLGPAHASRGWVAADADSALVVLGEGLGAQAIALERVAGRWRAAPTRRRDLVVTVDALPEARDGSGSGTWAVGWSWKELANPLARFGTLDVGVRTTFGLRVPARGTRIEWSASAGDERGSIEARGGSVLLRLPPRVGAEGVPLGRGRKLGD